VTLRNKANQPVNIFDYPLWSTGLPRVVYVDPCTKELPEGTLTICLTIEGHRVLRLDTANEHVLGQYGKNFVRHESWPPNLFVDTTHLRWDRSGDQFSIDGWNQPAQHINIHDLEGTVRAMFGDAIYDAMGDEVITYPHIQSLANDPRIRVRDFTYTAPERIEALLETEVDGALAVPTHIFVENNRAKTIELVYSNDLKGTPERINHDGVWSHDPADDLREDRPVRLCYFRRNRWPAGLFRLAKTYRYNDEGNVLVTVHSAQPRGGGSITPRAWPRLSFPSALDLRRRVQLTNYLNRGNPIPDGSAWLQYDPGLGEGSGEGDRVLHIDYRVRSNGNADLYNRSTAVPGDFEYKNESTYDDGIIRRSYYRFSDWPKYIWSLEWNDDGTPFYAPDAFGPRCPLDEDESSFESPIQGSNNFAYQKWFVFDENVVGHPDQREGTLWVNRVEEGVRVQRVSNTHWGHHTTYWGAGHDDGPQPYMATYHRNGWWPRGLYRRCDNVALRNADYYNVQFRWDLESDAPGQAPLDSEHRWGSAVIDAWVTQLEEEIGRPIYERPQDGMPWLAFYQEPIGTSRVRSVVLDGQALPLVPGVQDPSLQTGDIASQDSIMDDSGGYYIANTYRTGIAALLRPDCVFYTNPDSDDERRHEHPIIHYLEKFRSWFVAYEDPDLVRDLAVALHGRTHQRARTWKRNMEAAEAQARQFNERMMQEVAKVQEYRRKMAYYDTMDIDHFKSILERNRSLLEHHGTLTYGNNHITLKMNVFHIQGQPIGPLTIKIVTGDTFGVTVRGDRNSGNQSQYGHPHPHVDPHGTICWGNGSEIASQLARGIDPLEFLFMAAEFFKTGYTPNDAYCKIANWSRAQTWYCEHCGVHHPQGESCPEICTHCNSYVDHDDHAHCETHNHCYTLSDTENETCPLCDAAAQSAAAYA
jgi:hypothetical protein